MRKNKKLTLFNWATFTLLFLLFLWWHGAFEGPLSQKEIDFYTAKISELKPDEDPELLQSLLQKDNGQPIFMVNVIKLRDKPLPINGTEVKESVSQVLSHYSSFVLSYLLKRGSYPIYAGEAEGKAASHWGIENAEEWSSAAIVRYRSLRTLLSMAINEDFNHFHTYKKAAIEKTIAYPTRSNIHVAGLPVLTFFILLSLALATQILINSSKRNLKAP